MKYNTRIIKEKIIRKKMTNKKIAEKIGVHEVTISKWIHGEIGNIEKFINLCEILEIEIKDLIKKDN